MGNRKRKDPSSPLHAPRARGSGAMRIQPHARLGSALASALDPLGVGVAVVGPDGARLAFVNEAMATLLGATREELLTLASIVDRVAIEDAGAVEALLKRDQSWTATLRFLGPDGSLIETDVSGRPFVEEGTRTVALVVQDAREDAERVEMRKTIETATNSLRARDDLFSIAAHDLKTPLTALRLHSQALQRTLRRDPGDPMHVERARKSIDVIERHAERLTFLIDQLVDVSRIHGGYLTLERLPADLGVVLREVAARFGPEVATRGATLIIDGERSVPGRWDPLRLDQIVANLVSNALKYGEGKPILLELRANHARAQLTVRDSGVGIHEENQVRIFEPFERVATDARARGAGLGLWIVRRLVEAHGGEISVASIPGKGTVFVVDLPRQ